MGNKHQEKSEQTIRKLTEVAYRLFAEKGYSATSIKDITDAAGYTKGAFYTHFESKEAMFLTIMNERMLLQQSNVQQLLQEPHDTWEAVVANMYRYMIEMTRDEHWTPMFFEFIANTHRNSEVKAKMAEMYRYWRLSLKQIFDALQDIGYLSDGITTDLLATSVIALFDGYNIQTHVDGEVDPLDQIEVFRYLIQQTKHHSVI